MASESREPTPLLRAVALLGVPALLAVAVFVVFAPALDAGFLHWDDDSTITQNPFFRGFARENVAWMFSTGLNGHFQPLAWVSFALDHTLEPLLAPDFLAARRFHLSNLIGHAACALAVYWASLEVLALGLGRRRLDPVVVFAGAFAAGFFALHPLRVESVAWVTERRDLISGTFFALALVAWMRYGRAAGARVVSARARTLALVASSVAVVAFFASVDRGASALAWRGPGPFGLVAGGAALVVAAWASAVPGARAAYVVSLACLAVSLGAKAWGMVLPAVLVLFDLGPLARIANARDLVGRVLEKAPFVALALVFASLAAWAQGLHAYTQPDLALHTVGERVLQAGYGIVYYPWKTLWPTELLPIVELPNVLPLFSARFGPPLLVASALTLAALLAFGRARLVSLAWFAYLATIAPVLGFLQSGPQLVADRYAYLALLPLSWLLAGGLGRLFARGGAVRVAVAVSALAWLAVLGARAERQTRVWHDDLTLWSHAYALRPDGPEIQKQLAFAYIQDARATPELKRQYDLYIAAGDLLQRAAAVKPDARLFGNLSLVHRALMVLDPNAAEQHAELALALAERAVEEARKTGYALADYRMNLGAVFADRGRFAEAIVEFEAVTRDKPTFGYGWMNLGIALGHLQRYDEALAALQRSTELLPRAGEPWLHVGGALQARGDRDAAREAYAQGLQRTPNDPALTAALERVR